MARPSNAENCEEDKTGHDLSSDPIQKQTTHQRWDNSYDCGKDRWTDATPRIAPSKDQPQHAVTQDPLDYVGQKNAKRRAGHSKSRSTSNCRNAIARCSPGPR